MRVPFVSHDPYPALPEGSYTYDDAKKHAEQVDAWLGLRADEIEAQLETQRGPEDGQQRWIGLNLQTLQTPYLELRTMLEHLQPQPRQCVVDLGAAYGRLGLVLGAHYPEVFFAGFELVAERVNEGRRLLDEHRCLRARLEEADLRAPSFRLPEAEFYFLYDFGTRDAIEKTLQDLRAQAQVNGATRPLTVVGRGRAVRDAIERRHPWLSGVRAPENFTNYSVYRSA